MDMLYISKIGEIHTKEFWIKWYYEAFEYARKAADMKSDFPSPSNGWDRVVKLLSLKEMV